MFFSTLCLCEGLDVLVNNAGILVSADFSSVTMEEVDRSMQVTGRSATLQETTVSQVNLKSALKLSQESLRHLAASKGNIVNVSSISGLR